MKLYAHNVFIYLMYFHINFDIFFYPIQPRYAKAREGKKSDKNSIYSA